MLVTAKDDASGVFRRVGSAAGDVDKAHGRMARSAAVAKTAMAGLGIAAAGAAVYFAKDSVQAYASAEKAQLALGRLQEVPVPGAREHRRDPQPEHRAAGQDTVR